MPFAKHRHYSALQSLTPISQYPMQYRLLFGSYSNVLNMAKSTQVNYITDFFPSKDWMCT